MIGERDDERGRRHYRLPAARIDHKVLMTMRPVLLPVKFHPVRPDTGRSGVRQADNAIWSAS
ncbi:MAG: hypothetical protein OXU79_03120 [Gemmatimonadota bacterium]|nr:hypothetical protein [Gemmatimonadota bacterium]